jgi:hypothetical protein
MSRDGRRSAALLGLKSAISRPDKESWDFDGNERDFGEENNPLKGHRYRLDGG